MPRSFDTAARTDVQNAAAAFVNAGETFTSGHVTAAVRNGGAWAGTFGHNPVGREVRSLWEGRNTNGLFDGYTRSTTYQGSSQVFAYHPINDDPDTADLSVQFPPRVDINSFSGGVAPGAAPAGPTPRSAPAPTGLKTARELYNGGQDASAGDRFTLAYNGDGYAQVPRSVTRLLGLNPGDEVVLTGATMSGACALRASTSGETPVANLQPTNGQLRLRDRALMLYGVGNGPDLVVAISADGKSLELS